MGNKQLIARERRSLLQTYARLPAALVRGKGAWVWDADGKRYIDFLCGISVSNLGHAHPALARAMAAQVRKISHASNYFYQEQQVALAEALLKAAPGFEKVAFANTGAEANELLIKLARRHGAKRGRFEVLTFHGSFHGRTYGALSASGQAKLHAGMEPLLPGFRHAPYNDLRAAAKALTRRTAAILVEPVQGENGVIPGSEAFLKGLRRLADRQGILLLFDEIQTGLGRTGPLFAYQSLGRAFAPDAISLAKSLGGGLPLSAVLAGPRAAEVLKVGEHGTTMGGNPVACASGLALLKELRKPALRARAAKVGAWMLKELQALAAQHPDLVAEARGRGLMLGLQLKVPAKPLALECLRRGLIVNATAETVLRLLPPLNLSLAQARQGLKILAGLLGEAAQAKRKD